MNKQARTALTALDTLADLTSAPTAAQRADLAGWTGWGPLAPALSMSPNDEWLPVADRLEELLTPAAYDAARDVCDTSFFTPDNVVDAVFELLRTSGFTGGSILEPGCGSGSFMSRTPADMTVEWTGIDIDPTATAIAAALHPDATIITAPLEKTPFASGRFDAVLGNVPFSASRVYDPAYESLPLHEYFIERALDALRPGGIAIVVTSRHVLDNDSALSDRADLLAAVRLPSGAFDGTAVVADILVLRRRDSDTAPRRGWVEPTTEKQMYRSYYGSYQTAKVPTKLTVATGTATTTVSGHWAEHPDCVAGVLTASGFDRAPLKVLAPDREAAIIAAVSAAAVYIDQEQPPERQATLDDVVLADADGRKERSFHLIDGVVHQIVGGHAAPLARATAELKALLPLRDAAVELIELESHPDRPDHEIEPARAAALTLYTDYVTAYGALNRGTLFDGKPDADTGEPTFTWRRPTQGGFRKDPDYVAVLALEDFDQDTGKAAPAAILLRRVGAHPARATSAASLEEALTITLGESGHVIVARVAELLSVAAGTAAAQLEAAHLIFRDPANAGRPVISREYLSGNIRRKLAEAIAAGDSYAENAAALAAVLPADLTAVDVRAQLGVTWVTTGDIRDFTQDVFGSAVTVEYTQPIALWEIEAKYTTASAEARINYGTPDMNPYTLLTHGLNGKSPIVYDEVWGDNGLKKVKNSVKTLAAEEALRAIQARFAVWVWEDKARADRLLSEYNRRFNSHVVRRGDGAYLTFPSLDEKVNLWTWQRDAVDRIVSGERVMIAHPVGAGKTLEIICGAMTLRRLGLARKPLIAVPNHLLEQIAREAKQAYPTGKFLIAAKEDLTRENRRLFAARCATGDWDAIVVSHQAFTSIPVDAESEREWLEDQKSELRWHLQNPANGGSRGAKQVANAVRRLEERVSALRDGAADKDAITFEQLGVDHISVDEFHYFRRANITTRAEGFSMGSSKRATDLQLKIATLAKRRPGKPIFAGFTGTPWSNTLAETYVWQRYLQPERLAEADVEHFDAWAATFVRYETNVEVSPDGSGFRLYRRPSVIQNVPELSLMLAEVADLLTPEAIGLERPEATWVNVVTEPGERQAEFVAELADRADAIRGPGKAKRPDSDDDDNMLLVCSDGRRVALDPRLVGIDEDSSKVEAAAASIYKHYVAGRHTTFGASEIAGDFQLVLCDIGTPRPGDSQVYGRLRARLTQLGIPDGRIRFIHEATTDKARAHLFAQCREGAVSVLVGSTDKVGVGTNIQTRLSTLHHLDAPWRPSDIQQREGRALRPGNLNSHVSIYRYVTEHSFDAYMWQILTNKSRFIAQMFVTDGVVREIEDVSDTVLSFAEVRAIASGNPALLRHAELSNEVRRLQVLRSVWSQGVNALHREATAYRGDAARLRSVAKLIAEAAGVLAAASDSRPTDFTNLITDIKRGRHNYDTHWMGLRVRLSGPGNYGDAVTGDRHVDIMHGYRSIGSVLITRKEARRPDKELTATVAARLNAWAADAPTAPARFERDAAACAVKAIAADQAADTIPFEHTDDLAAAEQDLEALNELMTAEASDEQVRLAA